MRIAIGNDHRGFALKETLKELLGALGHEWVDFGCQGEEPVDYPDIARPLAEAVAAGEYERGILICGNGIGMSIAANKVKGIRAALCDDIFAARLARRHNDANVLCMGAWRIGVGLAEEIVRVFLSEDFDGGRHARRLDKVRSMEP
ncbi:MAG: ribose 5-phosphate isomerase [Dehalococcoidia bacterium SM23_28_2]|nr:MAG: ribose 5-phosphate isomerase [Dehalococcoidia bacterium SM23_28_2]